MFACQASWQNAVHELLDRGANPNLHSTDGAIVLPVHLAVQFCADTKDKNQ